MGKYDSNNDYSERNYLKIIANELAEANRLKRLELGNKIPFDSCIYTRADLEDQDSKQYREMEAKVKKLEEELEDTKTGAREEAHYADRLHEGLIQLKTTLDEIKKIDEELTRTDYGYWTMQSLHKAIQKALAKHEGKK